ncbi:hypothetical protein HGRIS_001105 [Hohenbuehelia grisea]|uniref:Uncharacterized protein n=1 Tax=Hohenbuehelia grisea TaxID=104357 RepID=A0ABR3JPS6_9AGAR
MDPSNRRISVTRRITYRYYYAPAVHGRSTLLSLHGVPSSSFDWHRQIEYFQDQWYGIIAPDGYAYWEFLRRIDAADVIEQNDPDCWRTYMALPGKTAEWLKSNLQPGWPEYLAAEVCFLLISYLSAMLSTQLCLSGTPPDTQRNFVWRRRAFVPPLVSCSTGEYRFEG